MPWESFLQALVSLSVLALVVEQVTELYRRHLSDRASAAVATVAGLLVAFTTGFGIFHATGFVVRWEMVDEVFTGLLAAGGGKVVNVLLRRWQQVGAGR